MKVNAWCITTNYVNLIVSVSESNKPEFVSGEIKRFTSKNMIEAISTNPKESRSGWLIEQIINAGKSCSNATKHQYWRHDNKPIELWSSGVIKQKVEYIQYNPVEEGYDLEAHEYLYSSAVDYAGGQVLLKGIEVIDKKNIRF